ncbi:MAG TPA: universal stress protein [Thermomicrobiales bacterium]|nr:universal stress protein [Thermomicrobiales bacterium]
MTQSSVLVPLDGSHLAEAVVPLAGRLATALSAKVMLLHVLEDDAPAEVHGERHLSEAASARTYLEEVRAGLLAQGVAVVDIHVHENREHDVARAIVQHAREFAVDLIALANHGRGGWREFFFGTIAQQVIRQEAAPVITIPVRSANEMAASAPLTLITMATNGSVEAEAALEPTVRMAKAFGVPVQVLMAVETLGTLSPDDRALASMVPSATRAVLDIQAEQTQIYLDEVVDLLAERGVKAHGLMLRGDPADAIVQQATKDGSGLLVLATHGRSGLSSIWTGSVGSKILARYGKPLLLVHAPDPES